MSLRSHPLHSTVLYTSFDRQKLTVRVSGDSPSSNEKSVQPQAQQNKKQITAYYLGSAGPPESLVLFTQGLCRLQKNRNSSPCLLRIAGPQRTC